MTRALIGLACVLALAATAASAATVPHGPVSINLPADGFAFKPGPGANAANSYCLSCHSAAYVTTQPKLTRAQWNAEVVKMRNVYGATFPDDQVTVLADYLTAQYGKP